MYAVVLVLMNELVPRMAAMRHGREFGAYALKNLRPWVYAISFGAFFGIGIVSGPSNGFVAALCAVLAGYLLASRTFTAR